MKQSISVVTLGVADLDRSRTFYSEGLRWQPVMDIAEVVFYQAGFGLLLALWPLSDLSEDVGMALSAGNGFSLGHNVSSPDEVDAVIELARDAGAAILQEPKHAPLFNGRQAYFGDPDGYLWEVAYNPGLRVESDGTPVFGSPSDA